MAKIVKIKDEVVVIGLDNGQLKEVRRSDCEFDAEVGLEVEIFESETTVVVHKVEKQKEVQSDKGINIKIDNSNNAPAFNPIYVNGRVVNKTVYLVLIFFLGGLGVHKFYAGKIGSGIAYFLFSWTLIPAIIAFIEFFNTLFKKPDAQGNIIV